MSPDARGSQRTAAHRFISDERRLAAASSTPNRKAAEDFGPEDFKARWWPAPDTHR